MDLRPCVDYLKKKYGTFMAPAGVHAPFLMAVLRVADYLQIQKGRAPEARLRVQSLRSPVSRREWHRHALDAQVTWEHEDPETIHVIVDPPDVESYLGIHSHLTGLQRELDHSWAVLGEVYRDQPLLLTKRRVRSRILDPDFRPSANYIPRRGSFGVSDARILNLLVKPLYGANLSFGVRELVQNAVDAVRERRHLDRGAEDRLAEGAGVLVTLENERAELCVADVGIGMTVDTVLNYFLKAGASFRESATWRQSFLSAQGNSTVLRSGRFGIGALSAFLLGDRIKVSSRHMREENGIEFEAGIDTDPIELKRCNRPVGTTVTVSLTPAALQFLKEDTGNWDWYLLPQPVVVRRMVPGGPLKDERPRFPEPPGSLPAGWVFTEGRNDVDVLWKRDIHSPAVTALNGLFVGVSEPKAVEMPGGDPFWYPQCCIFDRNGFVSISLDRTRIDDWRLSAEFLTAYYENLIANALVFGPTQPGAYREMAFQPVEFDDGFCLPNAWLFSELKREYGVVLDFPGNWPIPHPSRLMKARRAVAGYMTSDGKMGMFRVAASGRPGDLFDKLAQQGRHVREVDLFAPEELRSTPLSRVWQEHIGASLIPYDVDVRREMLSSAREQLNEAVEYWESVRSSRAGQGR